MIEDALGPLRHVVSIFIQWLLYSLLIDEEMGFSQTRCDVLVKSDLNVLMPFRVRATSVLSPERPSWQVVISCISLAYRALLPVTLSYEKDTHLANDTWQRMPKQVLSPGR